MTLRLREIGAERYARDVLPLTAKLWAGRRDFDTYVAQTLEIARSGYGRRSFRTFGLYDGATLLATHKRYERALRLGGSRLRAFGIGAVFTPERYRGRGYASVMLAMQLDRSRAGGDDAAYLFSDIRPQFYAPLGFRELSSREISLRADALPSRRLKIAPVAAGDWPAIRRCFEARERTREAAFVRTAPDWEWLRLRVRHNSEHVTGDEANFVLRRGRAVVAYVLGVRAPKRDAYVVDEFGYAGAEAAAMIPALLRAAAGDLRRAIGWLPPGDDRALLPRGTVRRRSHSILMLAPLSDRGARFIEAASHVRPGDLCWATEHI